MEVGLYIVSTPIGNLQDMTFRGIATLQAVAMVLVEDTRQAGKLWDAYDIQTPMCVANQHTEKRVISRVLSRLAAGQSVALISDAGTPLIHDPGVLMVHTVLAAGYRVIPIPGPCAAIAALSICGFDVSQFRFCGFLPVKVAERDKRLVAEAKTAVPLVFYEAPHRLRKTIERMAELLGRSREAVLARELTKRFETIHRGSLSAIHQAIEDGTVTVKGEMVIIVAGVELVPPTKEDAITLPMDELLAVLLNQVSVKDAAAIVSKLSGLSHSQSYTLCLSRKKTL